VKANLVAPINTVSYGTTAFNIAKAMDKSHDVTLFPINNYLQNNARAFELQDPSPENYNLLQKWLDNRKKYDKDATSIRLWHQNDLALHAGKKRIGFPIFELNKFDEVELNHLKSQDELFVCSRWAHKVIKDNGIDVPTYIVPLGVDTATFRPGPPRKYQNTVFFNAGKWEYRKGHDILTKAFNAAFDEKEKVELWMVCDNMFYTPQQNMEWVNKYRKSKLGGKITIIPRLKTHKEIAKIMQLTDCGVFPARAEGWNLEALEMLACGKHLIITDYSAHQDFAYDSPFLIKPDGLETAVDGFWFKGTGEWAKLGNESFEQLVEYMRFVHQAKQNGNLEVNTDGIAMAKRYSWENTANKIAERI
jgi:glycosyltransferase involved in cell wall biosynthesis